MTASDKSTRLVFLFIAFVATCGLGCPITQDGLPGGGLDDETSRIIKLELINDSGVAALVTVTFHVAEEMTRTTARYMAATGSEATEIILPTVTSEFHVRAVEAATLPNARSHKAVVAGRPGDLLLDRTMTIDANTSDGDTIRVIIHPYGFVDCNFNDIEDSLDLANGTSHDCNANGVLDECDLADRTSQDCDGNGTPDECQIAADSSLDCNHNGILDLCDIADGTSQDCDLNNTPDECEPEVPMVVVIAEHESAHNRILVSDDSGTTPYVLADFSSESLGLVRDMAPYPVPAGQLAFTMSGISAGDASIQRIALATGTYAPLVSSLDAIGGITIDEGPGMMYWGALAPPPTPTAGILKSTISGAGVTTVAAGLLTGYTQVAAHGPTGKIYFFTVDSGTVIQRMDPDGTNVETMHSGLSYLRSVDIWPQLNLIAWSSHQAGGGVFVASIDGGPIAQIAVEPTIMGVAFDRENCRIYWSGEGDGSANAGFLDRAALDGSGYERVLSNLTQPIDISVFPPGS